MPADGEGVRTRALAADADGLRRSGGSPHAAALGVARPGGQDEFLTFQRGSQPHVALLDLCRKQGVEAPRVHNISSISAMVQLVESGFGVATLPHAATVRLGERLALRAELRRTR
jgi:DNA-binding transcriptional LysR family regulator